ncbi:MAG: hypothetical protein JWM27_3656 [Gemmatimonadetes bacterium]|nr:hypothetical protein [Gemmatimonadota bacterium]
MRWSPWAIWLGTAGALLAALLAVQTLLGRIPVGPNGSWKDLRIAVVHCLLMAYFPAATASVLQRTARTLDALRPRLPWSDAEHGEVRSGLVRLASPGLYLLVAIGLLGAIVGPSLTEPGRTVLAWWQPASWSPEVWWHRVPGLGIGVWFGVFTHVLLASSARLSRISAQVKIDLFDLSPLVPFTQQGLNNGLLAVGPLAMYGLISVDFGLTPMLGVVFASALVLVSAALLLPVRGAHLRIVAAKKAELAWCAEAVEAERKAVRGQHTAGAGGRFADLLAYQTLWS